jgi:predicted alpha/beta superfamily hydrolase
MVSVAVTLSFDLSAGQDGENQTEGIVSQVAVPGSTIVMTLDQPFRMRAEGFDYDHTIQVALPASYQSHPDRSYPVIWLMDGYLMLSITMGVLDTLVLGQMAPEMIIVAVGSALEEGFEGLERRRIDFTPPAASYFREGFAGDMQRKVMPPQYHDFPHKAHLYLDFLINQARPVLLEKYRMTNDHALFGHSHGGLFSTYALLARPAGFSKYMVGSPYLYGAEGVVFDMEETYAASNSDLSASVFFGAGDLELHQGLIVMGGLVSSMTRMVETLQLRGYPSLRISSRIFSGKNHLTVTPDLLMSAIRFLWEDEINALPKSHLD